MRATISYYPNARKQNSQTNKIPIYARICLRGTKAEFRLNAEIDEKELVKWDPFAMRMMERKSFVNNLINGIDQRFQEFLILSSAKHTLRHARDLKDGLLGKSDLKRLTLTEFVQSFYQQTILSNAGITKGTKKNYKKALNHLAHFLHWSKSDNIYIDELSNVFALKFKDYLLSEHAETGKKGMAEVSALQIVKKLRTIIDRAIDEGLVEKNPFKKIRLSNKSPRRERLTIHQVNDLMNLDLSAFPTLRTYRDIFMFSIFTGLAYNDAMLLTSENLIKQNDGNWKLVIKRLKTGVDTEMYLVNHAKALIEKYSNTVESQITNKILPKRSNQSLNIHLKILSELAKIPFKLTSHIGRHTFRQLLAEAGIEDYGVIKRMMGQSRRGDIDDVYYSITESRLLSAKNVFEKFLTETISRDAK